jgi:peroxiredoxin family protein
MKMELIVGSETSANQNMTLGKYPKEHIQLRKKYGKTSVGVAACTSQADTVQYKNNERYNTQNKNSNAE